MHWYFSALLILLTLAGVGLLMGGLFTTWLPARMQPGARIFLSVPLGWAVITLVATLLGWFGPGYGRCHCALITGALCLAGAWNSRGWLRHAGGDCLRLAAFCLLASMPILWPLFDHGSFALYNDTHFYVGHALWLQGHGFAEAARTDGGHPLWGTVALMQDDPPLRMGAGFLLGWTQATLGLELPHEIFPVVAALGVVCASLGVGAAILAACPGRWAEAWLGALAVAVTVNGLPFAASNGFLPQTWGLAFAAAAFGLRGLELGTRAERARMAHWRVGVPVGVCAAASMHCYWELLPLEGPALACAYLLPWPGRDRRAWWVTLRRASVPLVTCIGLVNAEWLRAARGIVFNARALVANPVDWPLWHFPAHALGLKSSVWERGLWITHGPPLGLLLEGCAVLLAWAAVMWGSARAARRGRWWRLPAHRTRPRWLALTPLLVWTALTAGLVLYFRYWVPSPWGGVRQGIYPDGIGQSWSQYKLTTWASFAAIGLVAATLAGGAMTARSHWWRVGVVALLAAWCGTGVGWNLRLTHWRGEQVLIDTGCRRDPLVPCLAVRERLAGIPAGDRIFLDWPPDRKSDKFLELMISLLPEHPVASRWTDDWVAALRITPEDARRTEADCQWVLRYRPPGTDAGAAAGPPGGMTLERAEITGKRTFIPIYSGF